MSLLFQPAGASELVLGAVRSILMPATVALVVLPALSLTEALAERLSPSPAMVLSSGRVAGSRPERPAWSAAVQWTVTSPLYQPAPFGCVVAAPASEGAVSSTLMPERLALAVLPAASIAAPVSV